MRQNVDRHAFGNKISVSVDGGTEQISGTSEVVGTGDGFVKFNTVYTDHHEETIEAIPATENEPGQPGRTYLRNEWGHSNVEDTYGYTENRSQNYGTGVDTGNITNQVAGIQDLENWRQEAATFDDRPWDNYDVTELVLDGIDPNEPNSYGESIDHAGYSPKKFTYGSGGAGLRPTKIVSISAGGGSPTEGPTALQERFGQANEATEGIQQAEPEDFREFGEEAAGNQAGMNTSMSNLLGTRISIVNMAYVESLKRVVEQVLVAAGLDEHRSNEVTQAEVTLVSESAGIGEFSGTLDDLKFSEIANLLGHNQWQLVQGAILPGGGRVTMIQGTNGKTLWVVPVMGLDADGNLKQTGIVVYDDRDAAIKAVKKISKLAWLAAAGQALRDTAATADIGTLPGVGSAAANSATRYAARQAAKKAAGKGLPTTIGEVNLKGLIQGFGKSLAGEGKFFGWGPSKITKSISDFTKEGLLKAGWTKERLARVAEAYEHIARITPSNPSAAGRAAQLRELIEKFF